MLTMPHISNLSEREIEILKLVAGGASNKQIAHSLTISTNTVKVHLRNIFNKIEVASRTEAAMFAVRQGLVEGGGTTFEGELAEQAGRPSADVELSHGFDKKLDQRRLILLGLPVVILIIVFIMITNGLSSEPPAVIEASPPAVAAPTRWQEGVEMPTSRSGLAVAVFENQIYAIGGATLEGVTGVVESYNPQERVWETLQEKPHAVSDINAAVIGGRIYVPGGRQDNGEITNLLEIYDPRLDTWELGAPMLFPLSAYAMVAFEGKLFVFGGENENGYFASVLTYDPTRDVWDEAESMPTRRAYAGAAVAAGKIFVIGGFDGQSALEEVEIFLPELMNGDESPWSVGKPLSEGRYQFGITSLADIIFISGGETEEGLTNNLLVYSLQEDEWKIASTSPVSVSNLGMVAIGQLLYFVGGNIEGYPVNNNFSYQALYEVLFPIIEK